jgi:Zn finger protein HypA/HybF involved in hydrogenase expression
MEEKQNYRECERCGKVITEEEYETYGGLCEECYGIEIDEMDYEDESYSK